MDEHPIQGGVAILSVASCYRNQDKLQPCVPPWLVCDFTSTMGGYIHREAAWPSGQGAGLV